MFRLTAANSFANRLSRVAAVLLAVSAAACNSARGEAKAATATDAPAITVNTAAATSRSISRFVAATGTLTAEERADVSAEVAGRVTGTPVERGTLVSEGMELIRISDTEARASVQEAEANAAQIQARLGFGANGSYEIDRVPEVANAKASDDLAQSDLARARMLNDRKLLSESDFDRSRNQAEAARRQYDIARNNAEQQYQSLLAAQARLTLARKALTDTVVRAPFAGAVEQRYVSVGDYVSRATKVVSVVRINPMRVELTVPGQYLASLAPGRTVSLQVDAYPGQTFTGKIRYVSPSLKADSRALVIEAVVPNDKGDLKPGLFATAQIEQASATPAILVPATAVRTITGVSRVYVVSSAGTVEERIVTTGQTTGDLVEVTTGLTRGETVAASNVAQLRDGVRVAARK